MARPPAAFLSYVRFDDQHEEGRITQLKRRLEGEVRVQTGRLDFTIFQDRTDIRWGQEWKARLKEVIGAVTLFIPILTPLYFRSQACREELEQFLARSEKSKRKDLLLPIYYIDTPILNDPAKSISDPLATAIAAYEYADWRELRFESLADSKVARTLSDMALQIRDALDNSLREDVFRVNRKTGSKSEATSTVHVVDSADKGNFTTISAAIEASNDGDKILVRPGTYLEDLFVDKRIEIVGNGSAEEILVQAENPVFFCAESGRISNLSLLGGKGCGIQITQGKLSLESCHISSESLDCVAIYKGAEPHVRHNYIRRGKRNGIIVFDGGAGLIEDNEISENGESGVFIAESCNPTLRRNTIAGNGFCGIRVERSGRGVLEHNTIRNNKYGILSQTGGSPTMQDNQIHTNEFGVFFFDGGRGILENNKLFGNAAFGVLAEENCAPQLRGNSIYNNDTGVHCSSSQVSIEGNEIFNNSGSGLLLTLTTNSTVRKNNIHHNKAIGIHVLDGAQVTIEENEIFNNATAGVFISASNPFLGRNRITGNEKFGVVITVDCAPELSKNTISGNMLSGVLVKGSRPLLQGNVVTENSDYAIVIRRGGGGKFLSNNLSKNLKGAWDVDVKTRRLIRQENNEE